MIFAIIAGIGNEAMLEDRIVRLYPSFVRLNPGPGQWLLKADGTAKEISDRLGITADKPDDIPNAIVLTVSGFWGREPSNVWEWLEANWGSGG
jgi:hypothetical protein